MKLRLLDLLFLAALAAGACLLSVPRSAFGDGYQSGTVLDGYTYNDGYWWRGEDAYTLRRTRVYRGYGSCSYYYRNSFYKVPVIVKEKPVYREKTVEKISYKDPDWREKALELAKDRDEQKAFLEVMKALGYNGEAAPGYNPQAANSFRYGLTQTEYAYAPKQGNSVFGYGVRDLSELYSNLDVNVAFQQASRAQQAAQQTAEKGLGGMLAAIEKQNEGKNYYVKAQAVQAILNALDTEQRVTKTKIDYSGPAANLPGATVSASGLQAVMRQHCFKCHSPSGENGVLGRKSGLFPQGVDLTQYASYSPDQKKRVVETVVSGEMPQGGTLTAQEKTLFSLDLLGSLR